MESYKEHWKALLSPMRLGREDEVFERDGDVRSEYDKDCDRILFSTSFRRLGRKTQVHPLADNDHVHTRLTHSLEVATVGRSLGIMAGRFLQERGDLPAGYDPFALGSIVQAACLAHDIGNPPFGHAGEYAIRSWFENEGRDLLERGGLDEAQKRDFMLFEGNAQGFRIITALENNPRKGGLQLTYAVLGSVVKYPWGSSDPRAKKGKFNVFAAQKESFERVFGALGLQKDGHWARHPLSYLMEAADDICYRILDLEDAVELGIVEFDEVKRLLGGLVGDEDGALDMGEEYETRRRIGRYRAKAINTLINRLFGLFVDEYGIIMAGALHTSLYDLLKKRDPELAATLKRIESVTKNNIFTERRKVEIELGAYEIIATILKNVTEAVEDLTSSPQPSFKTERILKLIGKEGPAKEDSFYEALLKATDWVSGMTDNYAHSTAAKLTGSF